MDAAAYKMFLTFIKNTESMVKALHTSGGFTDNLSAQIGVIDDMIKAMKTLKLELENNFKRIQKIEDTN